MQNDRGFKKYQMRKKIHIQVISLEYNNFTDIRRNNSIFIQKKKETLILKLPVPKNPKF